MEPKYVIVQAGGKGSRMEALTQNKPKALVSVNNLPILFHLFEKFPKEFIIIGDYKYDVLERYLRAFAKADYTLVRAAGHTGNCAGLSAALAHIPEGEPFILIWCDLILPKDYQLPNLRGRDVIGISRDFPCRYQYENGMFSRREDTGHGVAGFFVFRNKRVLRDVPCEGEFVDYLMARGMVFEEQFLDGAREFGLKAMWDQLPAEICRPFNSIRIEGDRLIKTPLNEQGRELAEKECAWYKALGDELFENLPKIYGYSPLCMEYIQGKNVYEYKSAAPEEKRVILGQIAACLKKIHNFWSVPCDRDSFHQAYLDKTLERLNRVRNLVPFAGDEFVTVNGRRCRNVLHHWKTLEKQVMDYCPQRFCLIHGDCTFSNILLRPDGTPVLIDPRGYFGKTLLFGDPAYDWVKLYYSLCSNYDRFNLKDFTLSFEPSGVRLVIGSNGWEMMEDDFFALVGSEISRPQMKLFLAITWLSLTTYVWSDYDSICGAFYNGLFYYEEALQMMTRK